ncbi:hypothetical protein BDY21DRAFT_371610 [Lineolata rhizophorae]|uniref:C3H1-type domain-containing protein n=1 Tax=Lineolata rhizophorae TaxID=578093 RepID=A0A6A6P0P6_9PEZI|nr:hypothetical protein BDY21DRAFT_371610 [Lineolata rhizophorae]
MVAPPPPLLSPTSESQIPISQLATTAAAQQRQPPARRALQSPTLPTPARGQLWRLTENAIRARLYDNVCRRYLRQLPPSPPPTPVNASPSYSSTSSSPSSSSYYYSYRAPNPHLRAAAVVMNGHGHTPSSAHLAAPPPPASAAGPAAPPAVPSHQRAAAVAQAQAQAQQQQHHQRPAPNHRRSGEFRNNGTNGAVGPASNGNGAVPVPMSAHGGSGRVGGVPQSGRPGMPMPGGFEGARSPPNSKSTAHVPCKFFRQGQCQAGRSCPFLHSTDPFTEIAPCKYFQKGNCKFGQKCALAHILPDGRRVNRPGYGGAGGNGNLGLGGRVNPAPHHADATHTNSLLTMNMHPNQPFSHQMQFHEDIRANSQGQSPSGHQRNTYDTIPTIDTTFSSHPGSAYGSPPAESAGRLAISPNQKGLSVMDAPLPASFDSQGMSHIAKFGPMGASVPSHFGMEPHSPPTFISRQAFGGGQDSSTLRNLHTSAFGEEPNSSNGRPGFGSSTLMGSSPPSNQDEAMGGRRILHSERLSSRPRTGLSASLGANRPTMGAFDKGPTDDFDDNLGDFALEEDLVPNSLQELLTPQEKNRRFSRAGEEDPVGSLNNNRLSLSGLGSNPASIPGENAAARAIPNPMQRSRSGTNNHVGSPAASSPSRFGALFSRTHTSNPSTELGTTNAFGHVGSPLRTSNLSATVGSPSVRSSAIAVGSPAGRASSSEQSPFVNSPPRLSHSFGGGSVAAGSLGMLSQQLRRTNLGGGSASGRTSSAETVEGLGSSKVSRAVAAAPDAGASTSTVGQGMQTSPGNAARSSLDRTMSANSMGRGERIEEEQGLFTMEEEEGEKDGEPADGAAAAAAAAERATPIGNGRVPPNSNKRYSGSGWFSFGKASPNLPPVGGGRGAATPAARQGQGV